MYLNSWKNLSFWIKSTAVVAQYCCILQKTIRPIIFTNLETDKLKSSANQWVWKIFKLWLGFLPLFLSFHCPAVPAHASEHPEHRWSCLGQGWSQQCWTVESGICRVLHHPKSTVAAVPSGSHTAAATQQPEGWQCADSKEGVIIAWDE